MSLEATQAFTNPPSQPAVGQPPAVQQPQNDDPGDHFEAQLELFGAQNPQPRHFQGDIIRYANARRISVRGGPSIAHLRGVSVLSFLLGSPLSPHINILFPLVSLAWHYTPTGVWLPCVPMSLTFVSVSRNGRKNPHRRERWSSTPS